jgi:hypothetical protein
MHFQAGEHRIAANRYSWFQRTLAVVLCGLLAQTTLCAGQGVPAPDNVGAVIGVKPGATLDNQPLTKPAPLQRQSLLRTNHSGRLKIRLRGGEILSLGGDSQMQVARNNPISEAAEIRLIAGQLRSDVGRFQNNEAAFDLTTPQARVTSHGDSDFYLDVAPTHTRVIVYSGIVLVRPLNGPSTAPVDVAAGQTVFVHPGMVSRLELTAEDQEQDSIWNTSFPTDSLTESNRPAASHKKLYIILGVAGAAIGGIALATHGSSRSSTPTTSTTIPASTPTIPAQ